MIAAMNETTSRLRTVESSNITINKSMENMLGHIEQQGETLINQVKEIKVLGEAYQTQNRLISALQTTQVQQGETMQQMNNVQNDLLRKINLLIRVAQTSSTAEDRTAVEQQNKWLYR